MQSIDGPVTEKIVATEQKKIQRHPLMKARGEQKARSPEPKSTEKIGYIMVQCSVKYKKVAKHINTNLTLKTPMIAEKILGSCFCIMILYLCVYMSCMFEDICENKRVFYASLEQ